MSNDESRKTAGSDESTVVGQSSTNGPAATEQSRQASISVDSRVQTGYARPSYDLASLLDSPVDRNHTGIEQQTTLSDMGRPVCRDTCLPGINSSVFLPSARQIHYGIYMSPFRRQAVVDNNDSNNHNNVCNESAYALLIGSRDENDSSFTQACASDVAAVKQIISEMIPPDNIYQLTLNNIRTEREIEYLLHYLIRKKPKKLFLYYSGHNVSTSTNQPHLNCSSEQGHALDISRIKNFIESLLPDCTELIVILDCCSAGENLLLPMLPADLMPEHVHIQWSSSKAGGKSYLYATGRNSVFTSYIISALSGASACPNRDVSCPLCSKLRRFISQNGYADFTSMEILEYVHDHTDIDTAAFDFPITICRSTW